MKYRFFRKDFYIDRDYIYIFPTVVINVNNPMYIFKSYAIQFHWLCFNARLMWKKVEGVSE